MTYEESMQNVVEWAQGVVKPTDYFVDVGANRGYITEKLVEVVKPRGVLFVEPLPLYDGVKKKLSELQIPLTEYMGVVLDKPGKATMSMCWENPERSNLIGRNVGNYKIEVNVETLDNLLANVQKPIVIKIDTEFTEPLVWLGMERSLPKIRAACIEFFPEILRQDAKLDPDEFLEKMHKAGFKTQLVGHDLYLKR